MIIAIDGPAAAGKGTLARMLAAHLGYAYLDTGAIYRAVALKLLRAGDDPADPGKAVAAAKTLSLVDMDAPELRTGQVAEAASIIAAIAPVRQALINFQRDFALNPPGGAPGSVLDGRDIGTVICPQAHLKLYVTASPEARAHRRFLELQAQGDPKSWAETLADLLARDSRDANRANAPMLPANDAHLLDTTNLSIDDAFAAALALLQSVNI